jgi:hypothetical protein
MVIGRGTGMGLRMGGGIRNATQLVMGGQEGVTVCRRLNVLVCSHGILTNHMPQEYTLGLIVFRKITFQHSKSSIAPSNKHKKDARKQHATRRSCYELALASVAVPLSLVSFFASSVFFAAAICHAGIAARPVGSLPYEDTGFSALGVDAAGVALLWLSVVLVPLVCSLGAGVEDGCGVDVEGVDVPFVCAEFCD